MEIMDIEEILNHKNVEFINEIEYNNKQYIKTMKMQKNKMKYIYYEINGNEIKEVEDIKILDYFKNVYEIHSSDIIY